jgi:hypothetical protein
MDVLNGVVRLTLTLTRRLGQPHIRQRHAAVTVYHYPALKTV